MSNSIESVSHEHRIFPPSPEFVAKANISGRAAYDALCAEALRDYTGFWAAQARSNLLWKTPFTATLDESNANSLLSSMAISTATLPVTLPFNLTPQGTSKLVGDLFAFSEFRTIFFNITNTQKQATIRAIRAAAYLDTFHEVLP